MKIYEMAKFIGNIEYYVPGDDVETYLERLERLLKLNSIKPEDQKDYFLTLIGPEAYAKLKSLAVPNLIKDLGFEALKEN